MHLQCGTNKNIKIKIHLIGCTPLTTALWTPEVTISSYHCTNVIV